MMSYSAMRLDSDRHAVTLRWVPVVICLIIMATFISFRRREGAELFEAGGFDLQVKFQIVTWLGLGLLSVWLTATGRADLRLLRRGPLFWYACFVVTALISSLFSQAPSHSAFRGFQHAVALVLVISLREQLRFVYVFIGIYVVSNWILLLLAMSGFHGGLPWITSAVEGYEFLSGDARERWRFTTALGHPSIISIVAAVGAVGLAGQTSGRQWLSRGPMIALLTLTTVLTVSRTAIVGLAVGYLVIAAGRRVLVPCVCLIGMTLPVVLMSYDVREAIGHYLRRGQTASEIQTLTGRVYLYEEALQRIQEAGPFGNGFQSGRVDPLYEDNVAMGHAHNFLLESVTGMGILGGLFVTIVLISLAGTIWSLIRYPVDPARNQIGWEMFGVMIPLLAYCVLDSGFVSNVKPVVMLYILVAARASTVLVDGEPAFDWQRGHANLGGAPQSSRTEFLVNYRLQGRP